MSTEREKKKIEIGAVIDFCRAKDFNFNKKEIFQFFGVLQQTGNNWFPGNGSSNTRQPQQLGVRNGTGSLPNSVESSPAKRENPVRNGGRDRKRLKLMIDNMSQDPEDDGSPPPLSPTSSAKSSSSSTSGVPITPPRRKIARPFKKGNGRNNDHQVKDEPIVDIKSEEYDAEFAV